MAQYTANYQLHQWEAGDNFLRTDFNQDFAKIDTAIKAVENKAKTDTQALTASTNTQFQTLTAKAATAPVVLARQSLSAAGHLMLLNDLQAMNPGQYDMLRILFWAIADSAMDLCYLRVNSYSGSKYSYVAAGSTARTNGTEILIGHNSLAANGGGIIDIKLYSAQQRIHVCAECTYFTGSEGGGTQMHGTTSVCDFSGLKMLNLYAGNPSSSSRFAAGTKAILLGYKF